MVCLCGVFASMVVGGIVGGDEVVTLVLVTGWEYG